MPKASLTKSNRTLQFIMFVIHISNIIIRITTVEKTENGLNQVKMGLWGLHLTRGSVQLIRINSLNTFFKVKGHEVNTYKIIICHIDWP